jgi:hypothetical protein
VFPREEKRREKRREEKRREEKRREEKRNLLPVLGIERSSSGGRGRHVAAVGLQCPCF